MAMPRIRLLPATATALVAVLALKSADMVFGFSAMAGLSTARAAADAETLPDGQPESHGADPLAHEGVSDGVDAAAASGEPEDIVPMADPASMSASEIQVLQSLARRRSELDARARELDMQARLIEAAESRVDARVTELKTIEARINAMLGARDEEAEKQILALVKVYETMKPKEAARIFETLDETVLLDVATRMKPAKLAPILAAMKPATAEALTVKLARRLDMPEMAMLEDAAPAQEAAEAAPETTPPVTETPIGETGPLDGAAAEGAVEPASEEPAGPVIDISPAPLAEIVPETAATESAPTETATETPLVDEPVPPPVVELQPEAQPETEPAATPADATPAEAEPENNAALDIPGLPLDAEPLTVRTPEPLGGADEAAPSTSSEPAPAATGGPTGLLPPEPPANETTAGSTPPAG